MSGAEAASFALAAIAFAYLAVVSVVLFAVDVAKHRLPNRIVLPGYVVALVLFVTAAIVDSDLGRLMRALVGMLILFGFYAAMRMVSPSSIGGGDIKLAGLLGLYLGWVGWSALLFGGAAAFLIGGVQAIALLTAGRADARTRIAFGPAMLVGAWIVLVIAGMQQIGGR